jgi:hypothetical protein
MKGRTYFWNVRSKASYFSTLTIRTAWKWNDVSFPGITQSSQYRTVCLRFTKIFEILNLYKRPSEITEELWVCRSHVMLIPHLHWYQYQKLLYKMLKNLCVKPGFVKFIPGKLTKNNRQIRKLTIKYQFATFT